MEKSEFRITGNRDYRQNPYFDLNQLKPSHHESESESESAQFNVHGP